MKEIPGQLPKPVSNFGPQIVHMIGVVQGLSQVLQPLGGGPLDKLIKVNRLVIVFQVFVEDIPVRFFLEPLRLFLENPRIRTALVDNGLAEKIEKGASLLRSDLGVVELPHMIVEDFADQASLMPAGIGVIADISDPVRCQVLLADAQNLILNGGGNPGINPMANDV